MKPVLAILAFAGRRVARQATDFDSMLTVGFITALLVSPLGWIYYMPVALGPMMSVLRLQRWRWWQATGVACLFWPTGVGWVDLEAQVVRTAWNAVIGSIYSVGLLTLWWMISIPERGGSRDRRAR